MTEPIDKATKDLIEKEARVFASRWAPIDLRRADAFDNYIAGATAWAEKLRQLETQSHDQVRIIEHLEQELAKERELRKELVSMLQSCMQIYDPLGFLFEYKPLIQKAKDYEAKNKSRQ